ncbi:MAG: sugar phosphate isomerase/epimerase family protein [Phycisphaerae bacterium]
MKPLGIQLYSVRDYTSEDFPGTLKKLAGMGYSGVEFAGLQGCEAEDLRKVLDDQGLTATSCHAKVNKDNLNAEVEQAEALGYSHIVVPWMDPECFETADAVKKSAEELTEMAGLLQPHGITLGYHNHAHEMIEIDGKFALEMLFEQAPDVWAQLDTYWVSDHGKNNAATFVAKWAKRCKSLHIKDGSWVKGEPMKAVGTGKMDVPAVVEAGQDDNIHWHIVELDNCATDMMEAVEASARYLIDNNLAKGKE